MQEAKDNALVTIANQLESSGALKYKEILLNEPLQRWIIQRDSHFNDSSTFGTVKFADNFLSKIKADTTKRFSKPIDK